MLQGQNLRLQIVAVVLLCPEVALLFLGQEVQPMEIYILIRKSVMLLVVLSRLVIHHLLQVRFLP